MRKRLNTKIKRRANKKALKGIKEVIKSEEENKSSNLNIFKDNEFDEDSLNQISIEIDNNILETDENEDLNTVFPKKKKLQKGVAIPNNEDPDDLTNSTLIKRKRKRINRKNSENDDNSDEKELMEFINKKLCLKESLLKYKDLYKKKKKKNIFLNEDDEDGDGDEAEAENENNDLNLVNNENNNNCNITISINNNEDENMNKFNEKKRLKILKKNTDNKEMQLPLDTECDICCCVIEELANPDGCKHNFCKSCLIEWTLRSEKCPMCKTNYNNMYFYENGLKKQMSIGEIRKKYKKEKQNDKNEEVEKICYICKKDNDPDNILICSRCRGNFCHYYCVNLEKKPQGKWNCEFCQEELKEIRENKKKVDRFFL